MPAIDRRTLLAGAAATGAFAAAATKAKGETLPSPPDLSGKAILITGCSSGFGKLSAIHFAELGAKVFATMRNLPRPEGAELEKLAAEKNLDLHVLELDVLDDDMVRDAVAKAEEIAGGPMDVLVNNAGVGITGPVEVQDMEATMLAFDTNVFGYHRLTRAVLPGMRAKKSGHIFAISSQLGRVMVPFSGHYSATKFAVEAMFEQLAYELVPHNIEVTVIEPGGYPTKVWVNRNVYSGELKARAGERHTSGYPQVVARMGEEDGSGRSADPMDIPHAMARILAMPSGTRPVRVPVSGGSIPQAAINEVCAKTQLEWLGGSPVLGPLVRAVHD
ncbi:SDR family NAD(P)-dependent oxidoreductase [Erythrobacter gaetbuli]|uniref:SDR family NAD(P)-dependent oxidoreductase n=1 Tax=Qipengyuania gaetbuli TaxID=266952 RepID=A0A844XY77_9SPHN|nr:SDR family oxidoreductase [Qipengyuania gaetbuli]MXO50584.1 SDR family NAD(P)-dependent oxidoreductase [Qipengyuania gaetbuli]